MSFLNIILKAKNRGIKLKGSWKTSRLKKKRLKHLDELHAIFWEEFRCKFFEKHGRWLKPHKNLYIPKTKVDFLRKSVFREK